MVAHFKSIYAPSGRPLAVQQETYYCYAPLTQTDSVLEDDFSRSDLLEALAKLNRTAAVGPQRISSNTIFSVLLNNSEAQDLFLAMFNSCLNSAKIPPEWGHSEFFVLYKGKGDPSDCNNYRGISLQNDFFRLYERLLIIRIYPWGILWEVFGTDQCGFLRHRCTYDAACALHSSMLFYTRCLSISVAAVFIDFKKAFPSVNRQALINRLQMKGLPQKLLNAVCASLSFNTTSLKIGDLISEPFAVTSGTREGGILSPLEFNCVISVIWEKGGFARVPDDGQLIPGFVYAFAYADDIVCFSSSNVSLQIKLNWLTEKMEHFDLKINQDKTEVMVFHPSNGTRCNFNLTIENVQLPNSAVFKHLGFWIRDDFAFIKQLSNIKSNAISVAKRIGSLLFRLNVTDCHRIRLYFYSFVASQLYGLPLLSDVSEIYILAASTFFKSCFCLPVSLANCAAVFLLNPKSIFVTQMESKAKFFQRLVQEYTKSSILRVMFMDLEFLFETGCGWAYNFYKLWDKVSSVQLDLVFDSIPESVLVDGENLFWSRIQRDLITMSSLEMLRFFIGIDTVPLGFYDAIKKITPEQARIIFIFLTGGLRWSFFTVARSICPFCGFAFNSRHIFVCQSYLAVNATRTLFNVQGYRDMNMWDEVLYEILYTLRWWAYECRSVRAVFKSSI
jgi:hypothetical protein